MPRQRMTVAALSIACAVLTGCSEDEDHARRLSPLPPSPEDDSVTAGGGAGGAGGNEHPDLPCEWPGGAATRVYPAGAAPALERLASVGDRWLAAGSAGYVFFDRDGENADPVPHVLGASLSAIASEGDTGGVVASGNAIQYQRFAEDGAPMTAPLGVAAQPPVGLAVTSNAGDTLVVWAYNSRLRARGVDNGGVAGSAGFVGDAYDVQLAAYATFVFVAAAARGDEFGVVWSGDPQIGSHQTLFIRTGATAPLGDATRLLETPAPHHVARLIATDDGYALLLNGDGGDGVELMTLDASGAVTGHVVSLEGTTLAYDMASLDGGFAIVAARPSGEPQMRAFGLDLQPVGPWVCLGPDHDPFRPPAIAADGAGYATLHTAVDGAVLLHRLDAVGGTAR